MATQRYLETMEEAGLSEVFLPTLRDRRDGRLWRSRPGAALVQRATRRDAG